MALEASATPSQTSSDLRSTFSIPSLETRSDTFIATCLVVVALLLFFFRLDQPQTYSYDEVYHAYTAAQLAAGNTDAYVWYTQKPADRPPKTSYEWSHPAFAKLPMQIGIVLFGDTPFGWRFMNAIWGALTIGLMYALGRVLFNRTIGVLGAGLLLFEGLWFVQSRTAMNDVYLVSWIMLAYLLFFVYLRTADTRRFWWLFGAGAAIGLAVATKWSALYSFGLLGLFATLREAERSEGRPLNLLRSFGALFGAFIVVPLTLYIGSYVQFFILHHLNPPSFCPFLRNTDGFVQSLSIHYPAAAEWVVLQQQMWKYHSGLTATHGWASRWWTWPLLIRPVWYHITYNSDTTITNAFAMGNPVVWWAFLPAMFYVTWQWFVGHSRRIALGLIGFGFVWYLLVSLVVPDIRLVVRSFGFLPAAGYAVWQLFNGRVTSIALGLILVGFFGQWLPWMLSPRISFFYHMLPSVPFACLGIAYALQHLQIPRKVVVGYLALVVAGFLFFYPHMAALTIPRAYSSLLYWLPTWAPSGQLPPLYQQLQAWFQ